MVKSMLLSLKRALSKSFTTEVHRAWINGEHACCSVYWFSNCRHVQAGFSKFFLVLFPMLPKETRVKQFGLCVAVHEAVTMQVTVPAAKSEPDVAHDAPHIVIQAFEVCCKIAGVLSLIRRVSVLLCSQRKIASIPEHGPITQTAKLSKGLPPTGGAPLILFSVFAHVLSANEL
jgi:hypothetical protein